MAQKKFNTMKNEPAGKLKWLDIASMGLSGLCVVHCLVLPVAAMALPLAGSLSDHDWVHPVLVLIAAPLSLWALWTSNAWRNWRVAGPITAGLALLGLAAFVPALADLDTLLTVVGALSIGAGHLFNYLAQRPLHVHTPDCGH